MNENQTNIAGGNCNIAMLWPLSTPYDDLTVNEKQF